MVERDSSSDTEKSLAGFVTSLVRVSQNKQRLRSESSAVVASTQFDGSVMRDARFWAGGRWEEVVMGTQYGEDRGSLQKRGSGARNGA